jgi:hypothetical protein
MKFKGGTVAGGNVMAGLSQNPSFSASYTNIDFAWYDNITDWRIYEAGVAQVTVAGAVRAEDVAWITYDGTTVRYWLNGTLKRSVVAAGLTLFFDSAFFGWNDSKMNSIEFGPMPESTSGALPAVDTPELGDAAATDLYILYDQSFSQAGAGSPGNTFTLETLTVPAHDSDHVAIATAMFQANRTVGGGVVTFWIDSQTSGLFATSMQLDGTGTTLQHFAMQFQFPIAANQPAQTYRVLAAIPAGTTVGGQAMSFQVEVIKK